MYSMPRIPKNCCRQLPNSRINRMLKNWQEPHRAEACEAFAKLPSGAGGGEQAPFEWNARPFPYRRPWVETMK